MTNLELNIPSNLQRGDYISCRIDNEVVSGEVFISPKDVAVRLTAEGMGLQASVHIMLMQPSTYTQGDSPYIANERAVSRIQTLMIGLAQDYIIVQRNKNKILNRLPQYRDALFVHEDTLADLSQEKKWQKCLSALLLQVKLFSTLQMELIQLILRPLLTEMKLVHGLCHQ